MRGKRSNSTVAHGAEAFCFACLLWAPFAGLVVLAVALAAPSPVEAGRTPPGHRMKGACKSEGALRVDVLKGPRWNGWGVDTSQSRFQPKEAAQLAAKDVPRLKLKWAFGFPDEVRSIAQPSVVGGRVFIGSQSGEVYSLDARSGCIAWRFHAESWVRSAVVIGPAKNGLAAYFGDGHANVYAVDASTGVQLWKTRVDDHKFAQITGSPTLAGTTLYAPVSSTEESAAADAGYPCCTFRGSVVALDTASGKPLWKGLTIPETATVRSRGERPVKQFGPSGAAIWSSPTFDAAKNAIYATTGDNYSEPATATSDAILAFEASSGAMLWSRQTTSGDTFNVACQMPVAMDNCPKRIGPDQDFGSSAILVELAGGRRALVAGQKSGVVTAVDPDRGGEILWQKRIGAGGSLGGVQWGMASDGAKIYAAVSDAKFGFAPCGAPGSQPASFNPLICNVMDNKVGGGLHALKIETGEEIWQTAPPGCGGAIGCSPAQSAAVTAIPGVVFSGGLDGHMRAYDARRGRIVWDFDTKRKFRTVNGVPSHGGSIDGPGPVVVGGEVFVTSGSAFLGTIAGNVLLAFTVGGR